MEEQECWSYAHLDGRARRSPRPNCMPLRLHTLDGVRVRNRRRFLISELLSSKGQMVALHTGSVRCHIDVHNVRLVLPWHRNRT